MESQPTAPPENVSERSVQVLDRWRLIGAYWAVQALFVCAAAPLWILQGESVDGPKGHPLGVMDWSRVLDLCSRVDFWLSVSVVLGVLMALQVIIVWPVRKPRSKTQKGWALRFSIGAAALVGTALAVAIVLGLATIFQLLETRLPREASDVLLWAFVIGCIVSYIWGSVLMHRFCRRGVLAGERVESLLGRIAATLFMGTLVEAVAIMPIDVMFRKRQDCYCFAGTFWGCTLLLAAGLVTLGPAILLPLLTRRRKRWYASRCDCCGYDMTGFIGADRAIDRCPECGAGWRVDKVP